MLGDLDYVKPFNPSRQRDVKLNELAQLNFMLLLLLLLLLVLYVLSYVPCAWVLGSWNAARRRW